MYTNLSWKNIFNLSIVTDSLGKTEAGIWEGNIAWLGSFEECESATDYATPDDGVQFTSEYCTLMMVMYFFLFLADLSLLRYY